jgi:hypothetical protein
LNSASARVGRRGVGARGGRHRTCAASMSAEKSLSPCSVLTSTFGQANSAFTTAVWPWCAASASAGHWSFVTSFVEHLVCMSGLTCGTHARAGYEGGGVETVRGG